ncbi:unnamed protein product [Paramecium pentaurelia]|uniref:Uncharacterized protein n=1 Tax=Paramecium pentaurelia TaxID=43138 RepID=A0A8S1TAE3_9CILI|nr:unnamed protein product [Paramecium pentaurelia]
MKRKLYKIIINFSQLLNFLLPNSKPYLKATQYYRSQVIKRRMLSQIFLKILQFLNAYGFTGALIEQLQNKLNQTEQKFLLLEITMILAKKLQMSQRISSWIVFRKVQNYNNKKDQMQIKFEKISESLRNCQVNQELIYTC